MIPLLLLLDRHLTNDTKWLALTGSVRQSDTRHATVPPTSNVSVSRNLAGIDPSPAAPPENGQVCILDCCTPPPPPPGTDYSTLTDVSGFVCMHHAGERLRHASIIDLRNTTRTAKVSEQCGMK